MMGKEEKKTLNDIQYIKLVSVGSINPNTPFSEEARQQQVEILNRCLNDFPKGTIIGLDRAIGRYQIGEHELLMEKITYHVGFSRKPAWDQNISPQ